jgi:hypothetical protein
VSLARFAKGFRPSQHHKLAQFGAPHPSAAPLPFAVAYALRGLLGDPFDQGRSSGCVWHALPTLLGLACIAAGTPLLWTPSPWDGYAATRAEETPGTGPLPDAGVEPADAFVVLPRVGIRAMRGPTPDGRNSDIWTAEDIEGIPGAPPPNVSLRPTMRDDEESALDLVTGPVQLSPAAPDFPEQIASRIFSDHVGTIVGLHATPQLENWTAGSPALQDVSGFTGTDGHGMAVTDYRTNASTGLLEFWARSSWGAWGEFGGLWLSRAFLVASTMEAWVVYAKRQAFGAMRVPPAPPTVPATPDAKAEVDRMGTLRPPRLFSR